jgi:hypothetical protein
MNPIKERIRSLYAQQPTLSRTISHVILWVKLAILNENVQTLLDGKRRIEDNQPETEWKNIVTRSDLEEIANCALQEEVSRAHILHTKKSRGLVEWAKDGV